MLSDPSLPEFHPAESHDSPSGMVRRGFLRSLGLAALGGGLCIGRSPGTLSPGYTPPAEIASSSQNGILPLSSVIKQRGLTADADPFGGEIPEMKDQIMEAVETIEKLYKRRGALIGLSTGIKNFDWLTNGLHPGELIVVASRPSMGKTALALNIAGHVAVTGKHPVAIFSLELTSQQVVHRMLCSLAKVNLEKVSSGFLSERDFPNLVTAASRLAGSQVYIDDTARLDLDALCAKARYLKRVHDVQLIVIDHLQLLRSANPRRRNNRRVKAGEVCSGVKALAKELKIPIITLAQLNRRPEARHGGMPRLSDLRGASSIEQHADLVGLLVRPEYYADDEDDREQLSGEAELIIAKHRNGPVGEVRLRFLKEFARFEDRESIIG